MNLLGRGQVENEIHCKQTYLPANTPPAFWPISPLFIQHSILKAPYQTFRLSCQLPTIFAFPTVHPPSCTLINQITNFYENVNAIGHRFSLILMGKSEREEKETDEVNPRGGE